MFPPRYCSYQNQQNRTFPPIYGFLSAGMVRLGKGANRPGNRRSAFIRGCERGTKLTLCVVGL